MIIPQNMTEEELNAWWADATDKERLGYQEELYDDIYEYELYRADQEIEP